MNPKVRFGIIGCSSIAKKSTIPAIIEANNSKLEMIGSRTQEKAKIFSKEFHCSNYGSYDDVLKNDNVDAVYISLPISLQEKWIMKAAKFGKHVLCEKSAVLSYDSAKKIIRECKNNNVRIMENFVFKFHPQHKKVFEIIATNKLGSIHTFTTKYGFNLPFSKQNFRFDKKLGGGALNDVGCYLISACMMIFRDVPASVFSILEINKKLNVDVKGNILLKFSNGKIGLASFGYDSYFQSTYDVWGTKGMLKVERAYNVSKDMQTKLYLNSNDKTTQIVIPNVNQFGLAIEHFCKEIQNNTKNNFEQDLLNQALIMDAVRKSSVTNSVIKIRN